MLSINDFIKENSDKLTKIEYSDDSTTWTILTQNDTSSVIDQTQLDNLIKCTIGETNDEK